MSRTMMKRRPVSQTDDYFALIRRFPLRPIRDEAEYDRAIAVLKELVARADEGLSPDASDYTDVLSGLVREYDERHSSVLKDAQKHTPIETLKYLMEEHGMNTIALGRLIGGSGQASMILRGKRELSKANIRTLADHFKVSPALFI